MNPMSLAHYTAFLLYVWLIFFILSKNPKAKLNRVTAMFFACLALWSLTTAFYYAAVSKNDALFWLNITSVFWCSLASFDLLFSLVFTNKETILKKWYFYILILFIPAFFIYMQWTGHLAYNVTKQYYGWASIWSDSIWPWLLYAYFIAFVSVSLYLSYLFIKETKLAHEKKRAKLVIISGVIPLVLCSVTDIILVQLKVTTIPPIGSILMLLWAGGIVYAITKYKLMVLTPAYAASDILATMNDSLILIGPDGKIIEANPATLSLLGYSREEIIYEPIEIILSAKEASIIKEIEFEKLFKMDSFKDYLMCYRTKNGTEIPVSISGSVMRDQEHHLIGIIGVARDLREILRLQEKEREFIIEKARTEAFQERTQEIQEAYDKLKATQAILLQSEKMAAVGQLAGGVAHEINNPLGVILGFAQSIAKRIQEDAPLYHPLKSIEREAIRCKKLVGDLLTFSRTGKTKAEIVDINTVIDETLSLIEIQAKVKNIEIIKEYGSSLPQITANKNQLQQVIMNLCNNAIDAIEAKHKIDGMLAEGGVITICAGVNENQIEIDISDTGHGMTEEVKKHIFEPFYTTKEIGKGTGLGLSLCYEIIRKHKGVIEAESEVGKFSTFKIKLPINQE
ncbi:MAG TPA: ATP-binding protein [Bacillota bacterium]|nr:ATP-binding protein [Bacillota bacterium]